MLIQKGGNVNVNTPETDASPLLIAAQKGTPKIPPKIIRLTLYKDL